MLVVLGGILSGLLSLVACGSPAMRSAPDAPVTPAPAAPVANDEISVNRPVAVTPIVPPVSSPRADDAVAKWPPQQSPEPTELAKVNLKKVAPAARSPAIAPPVWDLAAYRNDPQAYLDEVFPGRVNQTATPAADVPFLVAEGGTGFTVAPGSRIVLRVKGEPYMPVTWTSLGLGTFLRTGLTSVSVAADADGHAFATWIATPGTTGNASILAASPTRAGQVAFLVRISE